VPLRLFLGVLASWRLLLSAEEYEMILGYNTNGLAHHDLFDAIQLLADIGYRGAAITLDHGALNPYSHGYDSQVDRLRGLAVDRQMTWVVETGARYLLDPRHKHEPTLVSPNENDRARRVEFLKRAIDTARLIEAKCVSLWSGVSHDGASFDESSQRLVAGLAEVLAYAQRKQVLLAFEPEPGMLIHSLGAYARLKQQLADAGAPLDALRLTIDIGHLHCQNETPIADKLREWRDEVVNIHIEDMRDGLHEHLMFGDGQIKFPPIIAALRETGYDGPLNVELSRHSHQAPIAAQQAYVFLNTLINRHTH